MDKVYQMADDVMMMYLQNESKQNQVYLRLMVNRCFRPE